MEPNDILIRITKAPNGGYIREVAIAINDESMLPEMERTAEFIAKCLEIFGRSDAATEYAEALKFADRLARPSAHIKLLDS